MSAEPHRLADSAGRIVLAGRHRLSHSDRGGDGVEVPRHCGVRRKPPPAWRRPDRRRAGARLRRLGGRRSSCERLGRGRPAAASCDRRRSPDTGELLEGRQDQRWRAAVPRRPTRSCRRCSAKPCRSARIFVRPLAKTAYALADVIIVDVHLDVEDRVVAGRRRRSESTWPPSRRPCTTVGRNMRADALVLVETTVPMGTCERVVLPILRRGAVAARDRGAGAARERVRARDARAWLRRLDPRVPPHVRRRGRGVCGDARARSSRRSSTSKATRSGSSATR